MLTTWRARHLRALLVHLWIWPSGHVQMAMNFVEGFPDDFCEPMPRRGAP